MMNPIPTRVLFLLFFLSSLVGATNFTQCLEDFRRDPSAVGGVDSGGQPVSPADAVGLTYRTCMARCGSDWETFKWKDFAQLFVSWLLPWLALLSQLPFGSSNLADDFVSVVMTIGSPALAAYSLVLTSLNARLVYHRAKTINHESKRDVTTVLVSVQQTPLELTKDERLLGPIPRNNRWRQEITDRLNRKNGWSLATGSSIAWVVIAFVFTLTDSFVSLDSTVDNGSQGHAVGTLWLWLLCLVIGWLWVPTFSSRELRSAFDYANREAAEGAARRQSQANQPAGGETSREDGSLLSPTHSRPTTGAASSIPPMKDVLLIKQGITSLNRDEHRLTATFNYSRVMRYLALVDDVLGFLDKLAQGRDEKGSNFGPAAKVVFPPGVFASIFHASIFGLILQCGTTAAAAIIIVYTPTVGLGCRSLGYIIYGGTAVIIMFLTIISTISARISETREERSPEVKAFTKFIAIALRRICFLLALANGTGLILLSCLQFTNVLDNCYCNASVIGRGTGSYIIIFYNGSVTTMRNSRIGGTILSGVTMGVYMIFLWLTSALPADVDDM